MLIPYSMSAIRLSAPPHNAFLRKVDKEIMENLQTFMVPEDLSKNSPVECANNMLTEQVRKCAYTVTIPARSFTYV
jgi:hypothetical protein